MRKHLINLEPIRDTIRTKLLEKYDSTMYMNTDIVDVQLDIKEVIDNYLVEANIIEPTIYITTDAYTKMRKLVDDTTTEVGWYGTVEKVQGLANTYLITDILVYPQIVTGATCVQDDDKVFEFEMSLTDEQVNAKRFHGHSHVNMGVTPSGVDEQFYQDILTQVNDFFIIAITNKRQDYTVRFYDIANNIIYEDVPIRVIFEDGSSSDVWYTQQLENLTTRVITPASTYKEKNFQGSIFDTDDWYDDYTYNRKELVTHGKRKRVGKI